MRNVVHCAWVGLVLVAACGGVGVGDEEALTTDDGDPAMTDTVESTEAPAVAAIGAPIAAPVRASSAAGRSGSLRIGEAIPLLELESDSEEAPVIDERILPLIDAPLPRPASGPTGDRQAPLAQNDKLLLPFAGSSAGPSTTTCAHSVTNHGGRVLAAPKISRIMWGNYWTQAAHTAEATDNDSTWSRLATSPAFFNPMTEYGVGPGSAGTRVNITAGVTGSVAETTIQSSLTSALVTTQYTPGANDLFVIFLPSGTTSAYDIANNAGGHHNHYSATLGGAARDVVYAVIEYYADRDSSNVVVSHEVIEASTDPDPDAAPVSAWWETSTKAEIGDICQGANTRIAGTMVQREWSQVACRCVGGRDLNGLDYAGVGKPNLTVFRSGTWYGAGASSYFNFGQAGDTPVAGDYNGDGRTEYSLFRPSTNNWFVLDTASSTYTPYYFGQTGDIPVPADYDGDGKTDMAVFRPSNGTWYVTSSSTGVTSATAWGTAGDVPIPMDYDGDGKADLTVRRPSDSTWYVLQSGSPGYYTWFNWGGPTDQPVTGDFNGDGVADWAFWRASEGRFYIQYKDTATAYTVTWGASGDVPVPRDYDGDWKTDVAVWRPSNGTWYVVNSSGAGQAATQWGTNGDIPVQRMPQ